MWANFKIIACNAIVICLGACSSSGEENGEERESDKWLPKPRVTIQCDRQGTNSLTITYIPDEGVAGYYYNQGTDPHDGIKIEDGKTHSIIYANLDPNTGYTFTAVAWNEKGTEGEVSRLYAETKEENYVNYFILNGQKYELLDAKMLFVLNQTISNQEKANYKTLRFEGKNGITINLQEKYPLQVLPYTNKWKPGSYSVTNSQDYYVYTCTVNLSSQPIFMEGTISLSYESDNQLYASLNCGILQGYYNGKYTIEDIVLN